MPHSFAKGALFAAAAFWLLIASAGAQEKWLRLSSQHFDMMSNTSESDSRRTIAEMERFRAAFFMWFSESKMYYPRPMLFVFNKAEQFKKLNVMSDGTVKHRGGVFMGGSVTPRIALPRGSPAQSLAVVYHECAHSIVSASGFRLPVWLSEGVAEVFETFLVSGDTVTLGRIHRRNLTTVFSKHFIPLDTFFNVTHASPHYNDPEKTKLFYAQAWLITHYIMLGRADRGHPVQNLQKFIDLYKKKREPTEAELSEVFGMSYADLEKALRAYLLRDGIRQYSMSLPIAAIRESITCRQATQREIDCELGALKVRMTHDRGPKGQAAFAKLLKKYPDYPRVWELYAEIASAAGYAENMQKAVALGSKHPLVLIWLLRDKVRRLDWSLDNRLPAAETKKLRDEAAAILALEPDCMEAHAMRATIEAGSEEIDAGIVQESNAMLRHMNDREYHETLLAMSVICWRLKDYAQAEALVERQLNEDGASPQIRQRAKALKARLAR